MQEILQEIRSTEQDKIKNKDVSSSISMNSPVQIHTISSDVIAEDQNSDRVFHIIIYNIYEKKSIDDSIQDPHDTHCLANVYYKLELIELSDEKLIVG